MSVSERVHQATPIECNTYNAIDSGKIAIQKVAHRRQTDRIACQDFGLYGIANHSNTWSIGIIR
jgi:hypothetical protein